MTSLVTQLDTRLISTEAEWDAIAPDWDAVLADTADATAFQSFAFLRCWWQHFGRGKQLFIVVAEDRDSIVGIAPLQLVRDRCVGKNALVLQFLGMPDELDRPRFLVPDGDVLNVLLERIIADISQWDWIRLEEIERGSWQVARIKAWSDENRLLFRSMPLHHVPYLKKSGNWAEFLETKSRHFKKRLRQRERKAQRLHEVGYCSAHGGPSTAELVERFFAIEARSWKSPEGLDVGGEDGYREFYRRLLNHDSDVLRGHAIVQHIDGKDSAATLGFSSRNTYYSLQIAHDARFDKLSPGSLLEDFEMAWFFDNPTLTRYEFLGGGGASKRRWTDDTIDTVTLLLRKRGLHATLVDTLRFLLRR